MRSSSTKRHYCITHKRFVSFLSLGGQHAYCEIINEDLQSTEKDPICQRDNCNNIRSIDHDYCSLKCQELRDYTLRSTEKDPLVAELCIACHNEDPNCEYCNQALQIPDKIRKCGICGVELEDRSTYYHIEWDDDNFDACPDCWEPIIVRVNK